MASSSGWGYIGRTSSWSPATFGSDTMFPHPDSEKNGGYCVMRYMKERVESENPRLEKMFAGSIKNQYYNQSQYNEVRSEWSEFFYSYVGA